MIDQSESIRKALDSVDEKKYPWAEHHGCIVVDHRVKWTRWNGEEVYIRKYLTTNVGKKVAKYICELHNATLTDPIIEMCRDGYVSKNAMIRKLSNPKEWTVEITPLELS